MGLFRSIYDFARGVSNDVSDKMTDPARAARLAQNDLRNIDDNALSALALATEHRLKAEKALNAVSDSRKKYQNYAVQAANQNRRDLAKEALTKVNELNADYEEAEADYKNALDNENKVKSRFEDMEKQRKNNLKRAQKIESRALMNKSESKVNKLLDDTGAIKGSLSDKLERLEEKVDKVKIKNEATRIAAGGATRDFDDQFKSLNNSSADQDIEDQLDHLMKTGTFQEKKPVSIEEKKVEPFNVQTSVPVVEAEPVEATQMNDSELDRQLAELKNNKS